MGRLRFEPLALFLLALSLLLLPVKWVISWAFAAAVHEICHYAAIRLCGGAIPGIVFGAEGARMETMGLSAAMELLCALAGPLGGLCLVFLGRWMPTVAVCALFQSGWNLLPLYPLDGGRALRCILRLALPEAAAITVSHRITCLLLTGMGIFSLYSALFWHLGLMPVLMFAVLFGKIACKPGRSIVQ